ncbi:MAG: hypothetical protein NZ874_02115 [Fimbriimonadales bacterium]|nr:hypothetical protein [Fimbriimonadales bacterium]
MAKLFRYEWRKHEDGGYMLYVPDETRLQEEKMTNAVREARRKAIQDLVQLAREIRQMRFEEREQARQMLSQQSQSLSPQQQMRLSLLRGMTPTQRERVTPDGTRTETDQYYFHEHYTVYHCLASLPDRAIEALLSRQTLGFSTKPAQGVFALPDDALLPDFMRDQQWTFQTLSDDSEDYTHTLQASPRNPEFAGVWLRMCSRLSAIEYQIVSWYTSTTALSDRMYTTPSSFRRESVISFELTPYLQEHALWRFWEAWATPATQLQETFPERIEPRTDRPAPTIPEYRDGEMVKSRWITPVDALEQIAWATRRPIISDAFRTGYVFFEPVYRSAPRQALPRLRMYCWLRADESGYLLARHKYYWGYRRYELPEAWLRPLEQKYEQQGWLTLDDYIALAGKLTDTQVEYFVQGRHFRHFPRTRFEFEPLVSCLPALRFMAVLNAAQRRQLSSGQWLPRRRLSPPQQRRFQEAVGGYFPPVQQLFREPPPEARLELQDKLQNLIDARWMYDYVVAEQITNPDADVPPEPAVRLYDMQEQLRAFILTDTGYIDVDFPVKVSEVDEHVHRMIQRELDADPSSRLMAARLRRLLIEFVDEQGERKVYQFVLSRYEPYTLPPLKTSNSENP